MATETGVVDSINTAQNNMSIIKDSDGTTIETDKIYSSIVVDDGVEFEENADKKATKLKDIVKVDIKSGTLTSSETRNLQALVSSLNGRGGGGGVSINIKTKS